MDRSETWMALASLGRYDGRRIDERSRQHLFRTSLSITLYSYVISFIDWLIPSFWFDWDRLKLRCWSGHSFLKWQNRKFTPSCGRICHHSRFDYRLYTISSYILFVFVFWKLQLANTTALKYQTAVSNRSEHRIDGNFCPANNIVEKTKMLSFFLCHN